MYKPLAMISMQLCTPQQEMPHYNPPNMPIQYPFCGHKGEAGRGQAVISFLMVSPTCFLWYTLWTWVPIRTAYVGAALLQPQRAHHRVSLCPVAVPIWTLEGVREKEKSSGLCCVVVVCARACVCVCVYVCACVRACACVSSQNYTHTFKPSLLFGSCQLGHRTSSL